MACALTDVCSIREERTAYLKSEVDLFLQRWQALTTKEEKLQLLKDCHEAVVERCQVANLISRLTSRVLIHLEIGWLTFGKLGSL